MPFPTFLWKKTNPDAIWLGPALILMQMQLLNYMHSYLRRDVEFILVFLAVFLNLLGLVMMLVSPLRKGFERGNVAESLIVACQKVSMTMIVFSTVLATINVIYFISI